MNELEPVRVGIVGLGRSGWGIHRNAFERNPDSYRVVAVADPDTARAAETAAAAAASGCAAYPTIEALLTDPNVEMVVVASPNVHHAPHVIAALNAGRHVVCEKPFGLSVADVDAMIAARDAAASRARPPRLSGPLSEPAL